MNWRRGSDAALAMISLAAAVTLHAQSINPPIVVLTGRANGNMEIVNPTLFPVNFVLEPLSFTTSPAGDVSFARLDTARIHLKLSSMSGRIPPRQTLRLFYEASTDSLPSWFAIIATFSRGAPAAGLAVQLQMSQMVYLTQVQAIVEQDLAVAPGTYDSLTHIVRIRIENRSDKLTRVLAVRLVSSSGRTYDVDAGPLFPNSVRDYEYAWTQPGRPVRAVAAFQGFAITRPIAAGSGGVASPPAR